MPEPGWRPTFALARAVAVVGMLLGLAVLFRKADLVVVAAPIMILTIIALRRRPSAVPSLGLHPAGQARSGSNEGQTVDLAIEVSTVDDVDVVSGKLLLPQLLVADGPQMWVTAGSGSDPATALVGVASLRWGRHSGVRALGRAYACGGLLESAPFQSRPLTVTVLPFEDDFDAIDLLPRAEGMVGPHRSRRVGEGSDVAGVRPFATGDRLRRINWRVSQRTGQLHVTSTVSDRDADVVLVLDTVYDIGADPATIEADLHKGLGSGSVPLSHGSLDVMVRAAAGLARHYLTTGDRVSLFDLAHPSRSVRAGSGRAHLSPLLTALMSVSAANRPDAAAIAREGAQAAPRLAASLPAGALVVVFSPLAGPWSFALPASIARAGHPVILVDTLPEHPAVSEDQWAALAWRIWQLERADGRAQLAEHGVPVVPWRGRGTLDAVLLGLSRAGAGPRVAR